MQTKENYLINLYDTRNNYFEEILNATESFVFHNEENDAENYVSMINKRQIFIDDLKIIDERIKTYIKENPSEANKLKVFIENKDKEAKSVGKKITTLDKDTNKKILVTRKELRDKIKDVKNSRNLNETYFNNYSNSKDLSLYDRKN